MSATVVIILHYEHKHIFSHDLMVQGFKKEMLLHTQFTVCFMPRFLLTKDFILRDGSSSAAGKMHGFWFELVGGESCAQINLKINDGGKHPEIQPTHHQTRSSRRMKQFKSLSDLYVAQPLTHI